MTKRSTTVKAVISGLLLAGALTLAGAAEAGLPPLVPDCGCEAKAELEARRDALAAEASVETAREHALDDVAGARRALGVATRIMPGSDELRDARDRLVAYEADVREARTPEEVADRFAEFMQMPDGSDIVGVDGKYDGGDGRCSFSDREIVAIVLGLILGIIPGLILIVLLC